MATLLGTPSTSVTAEAILAPTPGAILRKRIFGHGGFVIGTTVLTLTVLMAVLAPLISPHDPYDQDLSRRLIPPIWYAKGV